MPKKTKGFTLIELLVVIAIIALLMAILMPSLSRARDQAQTIACRSDLKTLSLAWTMYTDDHDGKLVEGESGWAQTASGQSGTDSIEKEKNGIKKGDLFPYVNDVGAYHCPADRAIKDHADEAGGSKPVFRSYAIPGGMNGKHSTYFSGTGQVEVKIFVSIKKPSEKYVFVEEDHVGVDNGNWGSWILNPAGNSWWDGMAILHHEKACLGFADGHAEIHKWVDQSTIIEMGQKHLQGVKPAANEGEDLKYMQNGYALQSK